MNRSINLKISGALDIQRWLKLVAAAALTAFYLTACADVSQFQQSVMHGMKNIENQVAPEKNNSPIAKKLTPYDPTLPFSRQFPRIAVTVLKSPPEHAQIYLPGAGTQYPHACYKLVARIWQNTNSFQDTPEFDWCSPNDIAYNVPLAEFVQWDNSARVAASAMKDGSTGIKRTVGPMPPAKPYPNDIAHAKFFRGSNNIYSLDYLLMNSIAYTVGLEPSTSDRRFWFVEFRDAID